MNNNITRRDHQRKTGPFLVRNFVVFFLTTFDGVFSFILPNNAMSLSGLLVQNLGSENLNLLSGYFKIFFHKIFYPARV